MRRYLSWTAVATLAFCISVYDRAALGADWGYEATGGFKSYMCSGFVLKVCEWVSIDAVKSKDGSFYSLKTSFDSVDEYQSKIGMCHVDIRRGVVNRLRGDIPDFQHRVGPDQYEPVAPETISFKCVRVLRR